MSDRVNTLEKRSDILENRVSRIEYRLEGVELGMKEIQKTIDKAVWRIIGAMGVVIMFLAGIIYKL